eukprot:TRINITY_DN9392_c0_g2_i1.p1 TRINITY_DN9392_c0_g2~~TRINITY_DN9392_c0_g2_i1.p1  ORF type:complete len:345 (+),score=53.58 TRINITY_DN9392_c0_g2_i1:47-1036(+)
MCIRDRIRLKSKKDNTNVKVIDPLEIVPEQLEFLHLFIRGKDHRVQDLRQIIDFKKRFKYLMKLKPLHQDLKQSIWYLTKIEDKFQMMIHQANLPRAQIMALMAIEETYDNIVKLGELEKTVQSDINDKIYGFYLAQARYMSIKNGNDAGRKNKAEKERDYFEYTKHLEHMLKSTDKLRLNLIDMLDNFIKDASERSMSIISAASRENSRRPSGGEEKLASIKDLMVKMNTSNRSIKKPEEKEKEKEIPDKQLPDNPTPSFKLQPPPPLKITSFMKLLSKVHPPKKRELEIVEPEIKIDPKAMSSQAMAKRMQNQLNQRVNCFVPSSIL